MLAEVGIQDTTVGAALITAIGLIIVALIGMFTTRASSSAHRSAKASSEEAMAAAGIAKGYVLALQAKDDLIQSLVKRVSYVEAENHELLVRLEMLERNNSLLKKIIRMRKGDDEDQIQDTS